jgi:hypothetical protein
LVSRSQANGKREITGMAMNLFGALFLATKTAWRFMSSRIGANRQHDVAVFQKLDDILDESRIEKILNHSIFTEYFRFEEREQLYTFIEALQRVENQYLHPVIDLRAQRLASEMTELLETVGSTFCSDDGEIFRFRPAPTLYDSGWKELNDGLQKTWRAYKSYRNAVKDRLKM